jgi:hypothetical protein
MMLRGRHRGLPYALDRAINLPSDLITDDGEGEKYKDEDAATSERVSVDDSRGRRMIKSFTQ